MFLQYDGMSSFPSAKVIGYLRVNTENQDLEKQKIGILQLANSNKWEVHFVEEKISGKASYKDRN